MCHVPQVSRTMTNRAERGHDRSVDGDRFDAQRAQAEIDAEVAASRIAESELERAAISAAREAAETGDPDRIAAAAEELHRVHALHEAKAGHTDRAEASLRRAARAARRLVARRARRPR
jgi:hypothetical protein